MMRITLLAFVLGCGSSSSPEPAKREQPSERSAKLPAPSRPAAKPEVVAPPPAPEPVDTGPTQLAPQQVPAMKKRLAELDRQIAQARSDAEDAGSAAGRDTAAAELAALQQQREELAIAIETASSGKARVPSTP